ncbi:MAG: multidrug resistance protein [Bacteroidia bacterium]|nr:multidrug resistance protein [Bacteroidia bacterium]
MQQPTDLTPAAAAAKFRLGLIYLGLNLIISVAAQFVLKAAMARLGGFDAGGDVGAYFLAMINPWIIGGLFLYGSGTVLWLLCLTKLELSFAYPVATVQYLLVFAGAWLILGENIPWLRLAGLAVIGAGVLVISLETRKK